MFLGKRDKTKTDYIPKLSILDTGKDIFDRILREPCEYKIWKIVSPGKEAARLAGTIKQQQLLYVMIFVNHVVVIVYDIINIEKTIVSLREKALVK